MTDCPGCRRRDEDLEFIIGVAEGVVAGALFRQSDLAQALKQLRINKNARAKAPLWEKNRAPGAILPDIEM